MKDETGRHSTSTVTPAMISAGVAAACLFAADDEKDVAVEVIFSAMEGARLGPTPEGCGRMRGSPQDRPHQR
jgi:hypothetical protein